MNGKYKNYTALDFLEDKEHIRLNNYKIPPTEVTERLSLLQAHIRQRRQQQRKRVLLRTSVAVMSVAASVALVFLLFPFHEDNSVEQLSIASLVQQEISVKEVTLVMEDTEITLSNNSRLTYTPQGAITVSEDKGAKQEEKIIDEQIIVPQLNKLIVPKGRRSSIILSDNSKVWLNSGTTLVYPSSFDKDKREIYVDGEIYIEVEKDASRPFLVNTSKMKLEVLGTKFNVSAYSFDEKSSVALAEGKVAVNTCGGRILMAPNQMLATDNNTYDVKQVDVMDYICWKYGWLQAHTVSLQDLSLRLSRYYGKEIVCNPESATLKCYGKIVLFDDIEDVLYILSKNMNVTYQYKEDKILLTK
jgi:ferric-dicitrate binding protein FerR (iron transport regulator)